MKRAWTRKQMKRACLVVGLLSLVGCSSSSDNESEVASAGQQQPKSAVAKPELKVVVQQVQEREITKPSDVVYDPKLARQYEIVKVEDSSLKALTKPLSSYSLDEVKHLPMNVRKTYRVVVPADIRQEQVRPTVEKIIAKITAEDNDIDEIRLFLYSDREIAKGPSDVARATWAPNGEEGSTTPEIARTNNRTGYKIVVEVRPDLEEYLKQRNQPEKKFGLSDEERKRVYKELVASEDKAQAEADQIYPTDATRPGWRENIGKNNQMRENLEDKYRARLAKKYGLSEKQISDIFNEGFKKNWPMD